MGKHRPFKHVNVKRGKLLAALRHARRDGSAEVTGENLAAVLLTMEPDAITRLLDEIPRATSVRSPRQAVIPRMQASGKERHKIPRNAAEGITFLLFSKRLILLRTRSGATSLSECPKLPAGGPRAVAREEVALLISANPGKGKPSVARGN